MLTLSRDVAFVCGDPDGQFIGLIAGNRGELHPAFASNGDQPYLVNDVQHICFLTIRQSEQQRLLAVFITISDVKGTDLHCVECNKQGSLFQRVVVEVHGDQRKKSSSRTISLGSKKCLLQSAINTLVLDIGSEIVVLGARLRQTRSCTLQLFVCCGIPLSAVHLMGLSNLHLFVHQEETLRSYKLHDLIHTEKWNSPTAGYLNLPHGKCQAVVEEAKSMEVYGENNGLILDADGNLFVFQIISPVDLTLVSCKIKTKFTLFQIATFPLEGNGSMKDRVLASTEQGVVYVIKAPESVSSSAEELSCEVDICFVTNEQIRGMCWLGQHSFLVNTTNKLLLHLL